MKQNAIKKTVSIMSKTLMILLSAAAFFLTFSLLQSKENGGEASILGHQLYIVLSGSMSPAIETGSLILVKPAEPEDIQHGDVITFRGGISSSSITTHRVTGIEQKEGLFFRTKGDANEVEDPLPVNAERLIGKVIFSIPYAGYVFSYARTQNGVVIILVLASLIILAELLRIQIREKKQKNNEQ